MEMGSKVGHFPSPHLFCLPLYCRYRFSAQKHKKLFSAMFLRPFNRCVSNWSPPVFRYRFSALYVHWGETDSSSSSSALDWGDPMGHEGRRAAGGGSEHSIAGRFFPAEIQVKAHTRIHRKKCLFLPPLSGGDTGEWLESVGAQVGGGTVVITP